MPRLKLKGCYYHYCQAVVKYAFAHCSLKARRLSDVGGVRLLARSSLALAYVESGDEMSDAREALLSEYETQRADIWNLHGAHMHIYI